MQIDRRYFTLAIVPTLLFLSLDASASRAVAVPLIPSIHTEQASPLVSVGASYELYIEAAAREHGVHEDLIRAIIKTESEFDAKALSPSGACGLMQIMPVTARMLGLVDCFDARENIRAGTRRLKELLRRYDGRLALSIAAYNAGEGAVARHGGVPPYPQTQNYVRRVTALLTPAASANLLE